MDTKGDRLRRARIAAGYTTVKAAADAFGWKFVTYRSHENGTREFGIDAAERYAKALKTTAAVLLGLEPSPRPAQGKTQLEVIGAVNAGIWREAFEWAKEDRFEIEVGPPPYEGAHRIGLVSEGLSMDKTIPPGSALECLDIRVNGVEPLIGDLVIVEREAHDLIETTVKRLDRQDGTWWLRCETSRPQDFKDIEVPGQPDSPLGIDDGIRIIGIVLSAQQRHLSRRIN